MALENLRQAVGQAAHEAAARALVEFEVKMQFAIVAFLGIDNETDIIGSLFRIAEQRIEKIIGPLDREKIIQTFRGKNVVYGHEGNLPCVGGLRKTQQETPCGATTKGCSCQQTTESEAVRSASIRTRSGRKRRRPGSNAGRRLRGWAGASAPISPAFQPR